MTSEINSNFHMYRSFILGIPKIITSNVNIYYIPLFSFRQRYIIFNSFRAQRVIYRDIFIEIGTFLICYI